MKTKLTLVEMGRGRVGSKEDAQPNWFRVSGMPSGHEVMIWNRGNVNKDSWQIKRIREDADGPFEGDFSTVEKALEALQSECDSLELPSSKSHSS